MKTNKLRKVIALLAAVCLLATMMMVIPVSADENIEFTVALTDWEGYKIDAPIVPMPNETVYFGIFLPEGAYSSFSLTATLGDGVEIAPYDDGEGHVLPDVMCPVIYSYKNAKGKTVEVCATDEGCEGKNIKVSLTTGAEIDGDVAVVVLGVTFDEGVANDPALGGFNIINPDADPTNVAANYCPGGLGTTAVTYSGILKPAIITLTDEEGNPVMPEDVAPTASDSEQWKDDVEAKIDSETGKATMRAFFEVAEQKDAEEKPVASFNIAGAYVVPLSLFKSDSTLAAKNAELSLIDPLSVGDVFAVDLTNIPNDAFDTPIVFIGYTGLRGEEEAPNQYWYGINASEKNTVNQKDIAKKIAE